MITTMSGFLPKDLGQGMLAMFQDMSQSILNQWQNIDEERIRVFKHQNESIRMGNSDWQVLYAPGHTNTQSCFYNKSTQELFSADMLLKITPTPVMEASEIETNKRQKSILTMLDSYAYYRSLPINRVYPGHYEIFDDPIDKIDNQLKRIDRRKEECFKLIENGTDNLLDIFQGLYKGRWHLPAFNMTLAYIDLLEFEGRVLIKKADGDILRILPT